MIALLNTAKIGDPKMDSGHLEPNEPLFDEYDTTRDLLPEEVLGVIDQMLCHEVPQHARFLRGQN